MEDIRIRFYSKTGNTKKVAQYIGDALNLEALPISDDDISSPCVLLILGGAPYANIMSSKLREYANKIESQNVEAIALFTTSNWSRRTVRALKKIFKEKNIKVYDKYLYVHMLRVNKAKNKSYKFAKDILEKYKKSN